MKTNKVSFQKAITEITSFDKLKAFEAMVCKMSINHDLRDRLIRQATANFCNACPMA